MKISPGEKLILTMLADIHKALKIKDPQIDADFVMEAIHGGDSWALGWRYSGLTADEADPAVVDETGEILTMWRVIDSGLKALDKADRDEVEAAVGPFGLTYEGFDGNHDPHYGVAQFMVEHLGRFEERKGGPMNSHSSSTLPRYREMLGRWRAVRGGVPSYPISKAALLEIFGKA